MQCCAAVVVHWKELQLFFKFMHTWTCHSVFCRYEDTDTCSVQCGCSNIQFSPVCGADSITYFSPCYAGCAGEVDEGGNVRFHFKIRIYIFVTCIWILGMNSMMETSLQCLIASQHHSEGVFNMQIQDQIGTLNHFHIAKLFKTMFLFQFYTNCSCIGDPSLPTSVAFDSICPAENCIWLPVFAVILFFAMFLIFAEEILQVQVVLR